MSLERTSVEPLFHIIIPVPFHAVKKNGKNIFFNKGSNRPFIGSNHRVKSQERNLIETLTFVRKTIDLKFPLTCDIHAEFVFRFDDFYTKKGVRRKTLPDLSNLVELPQDCLQKAGIIENDTQICSLDGSRRFEGDNTLEITLWPYLLEP